MGSVVLIAIGVGVWVFSRRREHSVSPPPPITVFDSAAPAAPVMRHGGSKRRPESPSDIASPTVSPTDLQTSELMRLVHQLNDRLRGRRWDEEELPPEYASGR